MFKFCPNCGSSEINKKGESGFYCSNCNRHYYLNSKPTAAIVPVSGSEMLLCIRADEPQKGKLDTIGGFLENGEDPLTGAVREFEEETGYKINKDDLKYLGVWVGDYEYQDEKYHTFNVVYTINFSKDIKLNPTDDIEKVVWLSIDGNHKYGFECINEIVKALQKKFI